MRGLIEKIRLNRDNPAYLKRNEEQISAIFARAKQPFYQYEPYYNRSDSSPSWQWHFLSAASKYKGRLALGGNRIGKSKQGAYEMALAVTGKHPFRQFPVNGIAWVVGLDKAMLRDVDIPFFTEFLPDRFKRHFYKQDSIWECVADGREWKVIFKSTESGREKFQAAKVDAVWIDEEPKKTDIFSEIETRLVDSGGVWWMTATPINGTAWLKKLSERKDVLATFAGMRENPYLPIEEVEALAASLTEDERLVRIEGEYVVFGGKPVFGPVRKQLREMLSRIDIEPDALYGTLEDIAA